MRIENNRAIQFYQRTKAATSVKKDDSALTSLSAGKTDQISISAEAVRKYEMDSATQNIAAEVDGDISAARLQQISGQIEAGQYRIPTESLVNAILGKI